MVHHSWQRYRITEQALLRFVGFFFSPISVKIIYNFAAELNKGRIPPNILFVREDKLIHKNAAGFTQYL